MAHCQLQKVHCQLQKSGSLAVRGSDSKMGWNSHCGSNSNENNGKPEAHARTNPEA